MTEEDELEDGQHSARYLAEGLEMELAGFEGTGGYLRLKWGTLGQIC